MCVRVIVSVCTGQKDAKTCKNYHILTDPMILLIIMVFDAFLPFQWASLLAPVFHQKTALKTACQRLMSTTIKPQEAAQPCQRSTVTVAIATALFGGSFDHLFSQKNVGKKTVDRIMS